MNEIALSDNSSELVKLFLNAFFADSNFRGTKHEKIFGTLYPQFKRQVSFGTGRHGFKKYGTKKYTVDFLDTVCNVAWEIDGKSHNGVDAIKHDLARDKFLEEHYGITVLRISNDFVEKLMIKRLKENGVIN